MATVSSSDEYLDKTTVADLIAKLSLLPQDMQIAMSSDEEGNEYYKDFYPEEHNNVVVIYPGGARLDIDELEDYEYNDED